MSRRLLRLLATLVVTGLCTAYLVWKIDLSRTLHILAHASVWYFLGAVAIMVGSVWPTARRHEGRGGQVAGSVLLERALGGAATLALAGVGFVLAVGHYDVGAYLWIEGAFVVATAVLSVALFSRRARPLLRRTQPLLRRVWLERPVRAAYEGIHSYREHPGLLT